METTLQNPDVGNEGRWTHGLFLRGEGSNFFHAIFIDSTGNWRHSYRRGSGEEWTTARQEVTPSVDTTPSGKNRLRLIIIGNQGWLYINEQPQGTLELSAVGFNAVCLIVSRETTGAVTSFEGFTVWKWHTSLAALPLPKGTPTPASETPYVPVYGPASGSIAHEIERPSNFFEVFPGPTTGGDIMVEATFHNPHSTSEGSWNYGFLI